MKRYVLISPCKDEEAYIERTLESVAAQTIPPAQWVIIDDSSTDRSVDIIKTYQEKMPYIKLVHRESGERKVGAGPAGALFRNLAGVYAGRSTPWDIQW